MTRDWAGWRPIDTAPRDFSPILAAAVGTDGRWMLVVVSWAQVSTMWRSDCRMDLSAPDCEWVGEMGTRYGVPITHWMPLPEPPTVSIEEQARREKAPGENVTPLHVYGQLTPEQVAALPWRTVELPDDVKPEGRT